MTGPALPPPVLDDLAAACAARAGFAAGVHDPQQLAAVLYQSWYCAPGPDGPAIDADLRVAPDLTEALRAAHADTAVFDDEWSVLDVSPLGTAVVERDGEQRVVEPVDVMTPDRLGAPPRPGDTVRVCRRRDNVDDHYVHLSSPPPNLLDTPDLRVYWNTSADSAPVLVAAITHALASSPVAWSMKLPRVDWGYERSDSAVLYLSQRDYPLVEQLLSGVARSVTGHLRETTPRLTKRLAPGVGLAEDPVNGQSFGEHRCELVAAGLLTVPDDSPVEAQTDAVAAAFRSAGLDPRRPHLSGRAA